MMLYGAVPTPIEMIGFRLLFIHRRIQSISLSAIATHPPVAYAFLTCRKKAEPRPWTAPVPYVGGVL